MKMSNSKCHGCRPNDKELIGHLRDRTLLGRDCLVQDIIDLGVDICNFEPWDLIPGCSSVTSSDPEWFFIYPKTYKHPNSNSKVIDNTATGKGPDGKRKPMINRATNNGNWKINGERVKVRAAGDSKVIGIKTHLYFYLNIYPNKTSYVLHEYELTDVDPSQNKYFLGKLFVNQSKPTNISSSKGEASQQLPSNYSGNDHIPTPEIQPDFHPEPLVEMEAHNDYDWIQNRSSISEQTNEFINSYGNEIISNLQPSNLVVDYAIPQVVQLDFHQEPLIEMEVSNDYDWVQNQTSISEQTNEFITSYGNEVISNLQPSNLVANYAIPQNLQANYMELIENQEVPNIGIGAENQLYTNQHDHSLQNVLIANNDQIYPVERSNQHNVVAENEGLNLPSNFFNNPIADISQMWADGLYFHELLEMNWCDLDDFRGVEAEGLYLHELFEVPEGLNNYDGAQNQYGISQQVADHHEFRSSNLIANEIDQPDERNEPAAAAEIERSNLPSLAMNESSHIMESDRKRSSVEFEGSSSGIETEVAQPQSKKSRF